MIDWQETTIRELPAGLVELAGALADMMLAHLRKNDVDPDVAFFTFLLNASAIAASELQLNEEAFMRLCREQYQLYAQFQIETCGTPGIKGGTC